MVRIADRLGLHAVGRRDARVIAAVDDDEGFRDALQLFLRTFEFQVEAFASGGLRRQRPLWLLFFWTPHLEPEEDRRCFRTVRSGPAI